MSEIRDVSMAAHAERLHRLLAEFQDVIEPCEHGFRIRDTSVLVGELINDCWDHAGDGTAYTYGEILHNWKNRGVADVDREQIDRVREFLIEYMGASWLK